MTPRPPGRLVHKADFERVLSTTPKSRSAHFALHHVCSAPSVPVWRHRPAGEPKLSTTTDLNLAWPVDDPCGSRWLGSVVPKRHARRSVTRNLLKRQIRSAVARHCARMPPGLWLVRLRAPFALQQFPSASSAALRVAAIGELDLLLAHVAKSTG